MSTNQIIALCAIVQVVSLIVVGVVSDGFARHVLQTVPTWIAMTAAVHGAGWTKWAAIPVFLFWILIALFIWLFLLGVAKILTGTYGPAEIAMTIIFATAGAIGIGASLRQVSGIPVWGGLLIFVVVVTLQVGVMMISLRYPISNDTTLIAWLQDHGMIAGRGSAPTKP